jgi:radical SAM protein with 4Fe4S-binding SPASM domain
MRKILGYANIFYNWQIRKNAIVNYVPEDISIELTNTCNFKCSFCPQSDPNHFQVITRSILSPEQADVLLAKLREGGVKTDVIHWTLDGEPFINKQIDEICAKAIARGFKNFIFATNGYFCAPERIEKLPGRDQGATYTLCIDFCADKTMYETHRGTPSSWERVKDNILEILNNEKLNHVSVKVTDISSFAVNDEIELRRHFEALKNLFPKSRRIKVTSRVFHNAQGFIAGVLEKKKAQNNKYNLCPYPWTSLVVASNGDVVSCCRDLDHNTVLGNLFTENLLPIWNGKQSQALRKALADQNPQAIKACENCDLPYDQSKFTLRHIVKTGINRLGIFK